MHTLTHELCDAFPDLKNLQVQKSSLQTIAKNAFRTCRTLEIINLWWNDLTTLDPDTFASNTELTEVVFSANEITFIDMSMFSHLKFLTNLALNDNMLTVLDVRSMAPLSKLTSINLGNNFLIELDEEEFVKKVPYLKQIYLEGNLFECSRMGEIITRFNESRVSVLIFDTDYRKSGLIPKKKS